MNEVMEKKKKDFGSFGRISQKHLKQQELRRDAEGLQRRIDRKKRLKKNLIEIGIRLEKFNIFYLQLLKCKPLSRPN
jgi:hypothetical protein